MLYISYIISLMEVSWHNQQQFNCKQRQMYYFWCLAWISSEIPHRSREPAGQQGGWQASHHSVEVLRVLLESNIVISMDGFKGKSTGKPHDLHGKTDGCL